MTMAILSVLLSAGYLSFSDTARAQQARRSAESIGYAIKKAKYFSRAKGMETSFTFTAGSDRYLIQADGQEMTDQSNFDALSGTLPDGITIVGNTCPDFRFNAEGTLIDSSGDTIYDDCTISAGYADGPQVSILIRGKTGNVEYR